MILRVAPGGPLRGEIRPPGDKSISHRALILGALAAGESRISGLLRAEDINHTAQCLIDLGASISFSGASAIVAGRGEAGLVAPAQVLEAGNSGTTTRLLMGVIASFPIEATLSGDASLNRRPMDRVALPLRQMGAEVSGQGPRCLPPVTVKGGELAGIRYDLPVASAQVKSALLLAGLRAKGQTYLTEPGASRDHTERMLRMFGAQVEAGPGYAAIAGGQRLRGQTITVPADISSAAFFIVAAALLEGSEVEVTEVGLNPTRTGLLEVLREMGAELEVELDTSRHDSEQGEPFGRLRVRGRGRLTGCRIGGELIPRLLDELPVLCIAAACAQGETLITGAQELRVKESDRISAMAAVLQEFGAEVKELPDGLVIHGVGKLRPARIDSRGDHRVAMAAAVAGLVGAGAEIAGAEAIATSYPDFAADLRRLGANVEVME